MQSLCNICIVFPLFIDCKHLSVVGVDTLSLFSAKIILTLSINFLKMYGYYGNMMGGWGLMGSFGLLTWVALITFLILGIAYFWKEINKPKGRR